jgi:hypothetical protein
MLAVLFFIKVNHNLHLRLIIIEMRLELCVELRWLIIVYNVLILCENSDLLSGEANRSL